MSKFNRAFCFTAAMACALSAGLSHAQGVVEVAGYPGVEKYQSPLLVPVPMSWRLGMNLPDQINGVQLPWVSNAEFIQQDAVNPPPGKKLRIGTLRPEAVDMSAGQWFDAPEGGKVWAMDVTTLGAFGMRVQITDMDLPPGAILSTYSLTDASYVMNFEGQGDKGDGIAWSPVMPDARMRVELYLPPGFMPVVPFRIAGVHHMYRDPYAASRRFDDSLSLAAAGTCHYDPVCFPTWTNTAKAIGQMIFTDGVSTYDCTGQLMATIANDQTPLFSTANHCVSTATEASSLQVTWLYQKTACGGATPAAPSYSQTYPTPTLTMRRTYNSTLVSNSAVNDSCLLMLNGAIPTDLFFVGWTNAAVANGTPLVGIHHPSGDYKRISWGTKAAVTASCSTNTGGASTQLRSNWNVPPVAPTSGSATLIGVTEGGSSGSGVFYTNASSQQLLIGTLSCGPSACGVAAGSLNDNYSAFASAYAGAYLTALAAGSEDASAPNQTCATAALLQNGNGTGSLSARIIKNTAEDWYRVILQPSATVNVTLTYTNNFGQVDMQSFVDTCGSSALSTTSGTSGTKTLAAFTNSTASTRTFYIRVYMTNSTRNTYAISAAVTGGVTVTNDSCSGATVAAVGTTNGTTVGYTSDGVSNCGTNPGADAWFTFTPTTSSWYQVTTCGSAIDTILSVHSACPGTAANTIACNDDAIPGGVTCATPGYSLVRFQGSSGSTYRIRVAGKSTSTGAITLNIASIPNPPFNDACVNALPLNESTYTYNTAGGLTNGPSESSCLNAGSAQLDSDVWFTFTATGYRNYTFSTCGSSFDTRLALYTGGTCPTTANSSLNCSDNNCPTGLGSSATRRMTPGQSVIIRIGGTNGASGLGNITISSVPSCAADVAGLGGGAGADGQLTSDDLIFFLGEFFAGNLAVADVATLGGSAGGDGQVTVDDLLYFLQVFFAGCP